MESTETENDALIARDQYKKWLDAIERAGKGKFKSWEDRGEKIIKRYRDERSDNDDSKKYNILWSNVQTLRPALYASPPVPNVTRRFDENDPVGKQAAIILEKAVAVHWDDESQDQVIKDCVLDRLLCGRGIPRVKYEPTFGPQEGEGEAAFSPVVFEEANLHYHYWRDFRHGWARRWEDVPWVAYRTFPDKEELRERWPDKCKDIPLKYKPEDDSDTGEQEKRAVVWEIWCKNSRTQKFLAEGYTEGLLESNPAPLNLKGFFPSPRPLFATLTNDTLIPVPDYAQYQDQADELDRLSGRINLLLQALRVVGVYDSSLKGLETVLSEADENQLVPVEGWDRYVERGGLDGAVSWVPIQQVIETVIRLYEAREQTKQELYEVTGLSDILRGASNPNETATAQKLKGQFGSMRLEDQQGDVARFVKECICLQAEVIAEQFEPETLQLMTGEEVTEDVMDLLRNDPVRTFRIDIETDSTIKTDQVQERADRIEFVKASTDYLTQAVQIGSQSPQLVPLLGQFLSFAVRGFKIGREMEEVIDQTLEQLQQPPEPDPLAEKVKALEVMMKELEAGKVAAQTRETHEKADKLEAETIGQIIENEAPPALALASNEAPPPML